MSTFARTFHSPVPAARAFVISRALLLILAFDVWLLRIPLAGRHSVSDFNVAHFAWLDQVQRTPTEESYLLLVIVVGFTSLVLFLADPRRFPVAALALLYSYSWAMTQLDSYQHHYYLSLALVCLVFFPVVDARDLAGDRQRDVEGSGFAMLSITTAIVYAFSAIAKLDELWLSGAVLLRIPGFRAAADLAGPALTKVGVSVPSVAATTALGVIVLECVLALAYLIAPRIDALTNRKTLWFLRCALVAALLLHLGIEAMSLKIGWFGYYMLALALASFLPLSAVSLVARSSARAIEAVHRVAGLGLLRFEGRSRAIRVSLACLTTGLVLWGTSSLYELPARYHLGVAIHQMLAGQSEESRAAVERGKQATSPGSTLHQNLRDVEASLDRNQR